VCPQDLAALFDWAMVEFNLLVERLSVNGHDAQLKTVRLSTK
jgi:hypothetical protein